MNKRYTVVYLDKPSDDDAVIVDADESTYVNVSNAAALVIRTGSRVRLIPWHRIHHVIVDES